MQGNLGRRLGAAFLAATLSAQAPAQTVPVAVSRPPVGTGLAGGVSAQEFLKAVELHLDSPALRLDSILPHLANPEVELPPPARKAEAEVVTYLARETLKAPTPEAPAQALAARFVAAALSDRVERGRAASMLSNEGSELAERVAQKLSVAGWAANALPRLQQLGKDMRAGPSGIAPTGLLDTLFDGKEPGSGGAALDTPEAFAAYAERRFAAGRLLPGQRAPVAASSLRGPRVLGAPSDEEVLDRVGLSPLTNAERERVAVELFRQAGAAPEDIVLQDAGDGRSNVVVVKKGRTDRVVVVGSHHDRVEGGPGRGTIDNWTGTTMVANLYQALRGVETEATFVFVAFAREEEGLVGSQRYVGGLSDELRRRIDAMVNLDSLAVDGTWTWKNLGTRSLLDLFWWAAHEAGLKLQEMIYWGGGADSSSFRRAGIPAATVLGISKELLWQIIHSEKDTIAAFSLPHYKNAYLLTLEVLKRLDKQPLGKG